MSLIFICCYTHENNPKRIPNIEAVVGIRSVFSPLQQCPLKLHGDLGDRVGRKLD